MATNYIAIDCMMWPIDNGLRDWVPEDILFTDTCRGRGRSLNEGGNPHKDIRTLPRREVVGHLCREPNSASWCCVARPGWDNLLSNLTGRNLGYSRPEAKTQVHAVLGPILSSIPKMSIRPTLRTLGPSVQRQLGVWICCHRRNGGRYSEIPSGQISFVQETGLWSFKCNGTELNGLKLVGQTEAQVRIALVRRWPWHWLDQHWKTCVDDAPSCQWNSKDPPVAWNPLRPDRLTHPNLA